MENKDSKELSRVKRKKEEGKEKKKPIKRMTNSFLNGFLYGSGQRIGDVTVSWVCFEFLKKLSDLI